MAVEPTGFPATLEIEYPDRDLNRLTTLFRLFAAVPILIVLALLSGDASGTRHAMVQAGGLVVLPTVCLLVCCQRYPRWWFDWNLAFVRFNMRVTAYLALLRDEYPSADEEQAVHLAIPYPDATTELNRWLPLIKWAAAIPHYVVLAVLCAAAVCCVIAAWFAILITGRYPRPLFDFLVGVLRWSLRVIAYAFMLTTDRYPPFQLSA